MVQKILYSITKKISGLHHAAYLLAGFTFLSQILGLVRDRLLAHSFGTGGVIDVYYAAFRIPDLILIGAASIVSIAILVPTLTTELEKGYQQAKKFIDTVFTAFFFLIVSVSVVIYLLLPHILPLVFPGFVGGQLEGDLLLLSRILLLSPIFLGISNMFASIVQVHKRFIVYALSPVLYNIGIIIGIVALYPIWGIAGLGYGVVLGALLHLAIQVPVIINRKFVPRIVFPVDWVRVKSIVLTSLPRTLTLSAGNIAILILLGIASTMTEGSIAVFNFAINLQSVPLALIGVSYSLAAFPTLSRLYAEGNTQSFLNNIIIALRHIIFWSLPAIALFVVLRAHIVRVVLGTGAFDWAATMLTAAALALFVLSVVAQSIVLLFVRSYYAAGNTWKPFWVGMISAGSIVALAFILKDIFALDGLLAHMLEFTLRVEGVSGTEVLILPLAYMLGMMLNACVLWYMARRDFGVFPRTLSRSFVHVAFAALLLGISTYIGLNVVVDAFDTQTLIGLLLQALVSGILGILVFVGTLKLVGNPELQDIIDAFKKKFWSVDVIGEDVREL